MISKSFVLPLLAIVTPVTNVFIDNIATDTHTANPTSYSYTKSNIDRPEVLFQAKVAPDSLFNKYYKATGGDTLWQNIKTFTAKQKLTSSSSISYDVVLNADLAEQSVQKSRIAMKREFIYVAKPNDGWLKIPMGSSDKATKYQTNNLNVTEKNNLVGEMYNALAPFYHYKQRGLIASYVGSETLEGKKVEHVELEGKGVIYNLYFDAQTHLLVRSREQSGGSEFVRTYTDYKKSKSGITYPSKVVELNAKDKKSTTISVTDLVINPVLDKGLFQK